jgi:hypothetical protein
VSGALLLAFALLGAQIRRSRSRRGLADALVTVRSQHVVHAVHRFAEWLRVEVQSGSAAARG